MSRRTKGEAAGTLLDLWRPPATAGEPLGCLATTYTFSPGHFDEHCLARFLAIESEPNREDLAFLLERESRLGEVYAGVLVDHTQAGIAHSLRWDVLPVRVPSGKQHAKISLLAWSHHVRLIVASANLTEAGYRTNREIAVAIDFAPDGSGDGDPALLAEAMAFLRALVERVPGAAVGSPEVRRAESFLLNVRNQTAGWRGSAGRGVRQYLACTLPAGESGEARAALPEAIEICRRHGPSPWEVRVASPFYDIEGDTGRVMADLCSRLARGRQGRITVAVPAQGDPEERHCPLAAPKTLWSTPTEKGIDVTIAKLPALDDQRNPRPWHAKMILFLGQGYTALMAGSSNFTRAGMGMGAVSNAEANVVTVAERGAHGREAGLLDAVWPSLESVANPDEADWIGARTEDDGETGAVVVPAGFLGATFQAGDVRQVILHLDPARLPAEWLVKAVGIDRLEVATAEGWRQAGGEARLRFPWAPPAAPERLLVCWDRHEAFLPLNVEDSRQLPAPAELEEMTADEMLGILAASDPGAAMRAWATRQQPSEIFDDELDSATPPDLDPLHRHDLQATFLHRVRQRAGVLANLRANLQRPVWSAQALEWRLRGLVGIAPLAERLVREFEHADRATDESLLTLADFLIVLSETTYEPEEGSLSKAGFNAIFRPFLRELAAALDVRVAGQGSNTSQELREFWQRVIQRCNAK